MRQVRSAGSNGRTIRSLQDNVESGTSRVRDALDAMPDVRSAAKQTYGKAQSSPGELLERQPLVLGPIGLAIGAVAAGGDARRHSKCVAVRTSGMATTSPNPGGRLP